MNILGAGDLRRCVSDTHYSVHWALRGDQVEQPAQMAECRLQPESELLQRGQIRLRAGPNSRCRPAQRLRSLTELVTISTGASATPTYYVVAEVARRLDEQA